MDEKHENRLKNLKTADESTRVIVETCLAQHKLPMFNSEETDLKAEEAWRRLGQYVGVLYQEVFDKVFSKLNEARDVQADIR